MQKFNSLKIVWPKNQCSQKSFQKILQILSKKITKVVRRSGNFSSLWVSFLGVMDLIGSDHLCWIEHSFFWDSSVRYFKMSSCLLRNRVFVSCLIANSKLQLRSSNKSIQSATSAENQGLEYLQSDGQNIISRVGRFVNTIGMK